MTERTFNQTREGVIARCSTCGETRLTFVPDLCCLMEAHRAPARCKRCRDLTWHEWRKGQPHV